jgi:two-component system NtrC family response regulator
VSAILIIDDDPRINTILTDLADRMGSRTHCAGTIGQGLDALSKDAYDLIMLDVGLPDGNGLHILPQIRQTGNPPEVIILTGNGDPDAAELAIKNGAWDYLVKPATIPDIMFKIERALTYRREKQASPLPKVLKRDDIVGNSPGFNAVLERVAQASCSDANVLIYGETGTGKELMARTIHENSDRAGQPFVIVDCAALPETLVESILFGHMKGAFTGADADRTGLIRQAHGGTLFLDEVGELPISTQKKFLRLIQERRFRPVSGKNEIESDFRLIAATNRDLDAMVEKKRFRSDLLFRIRVFSIDTIPLRRRPQDIKLLTTHHLNHLYETTGTETKGLSVEFLTALQQYRWPGNVRELFHALEEALCTAGGESTLYAHHLPVRIRAILTRMMVSATTSANPDRQDVREVGDSSDDEWVPLADYRDRMDRRYLERLLKAPNGKRNEACRISGLSRTRLFELLKKHDLADVRPKPVSAVNR